MPDLTEELRLTHTSPANPTYVYVSAFVDELQRAGIQNVVVCPGSRSTPLALVLAQHPTIHTWMHVDERSAAFFALGMAKGLSQPVALLCTSGTAAANFLPAVVEAKLTHIPLLILTADRPPELRDTGAPQAIDQIRLYGTHVKWFAELALPEATNSALRYVRTIASRATALTQALPSGPVHLNLPFREPLTPDPQADQPLPPVEQRDPIAWDGRPDHAPYVTVTDSPLASASPATLALLAQRLRTLRRGLILVGPQYDARLIEPLLQLAQRLGYPILADPLSQLRSGPHDHSHIISNYDAFLRLPFFTAQVAPQFILRFGAMPTAKPLLLYLKRYADCPQVIIDGQSAWDEPTQLASDLIHADPLAFCRDLLATLNQQSLPAAPTHNPWLTTWRDTASSTQQALEQTINNFPQPFEGRVFTELSAQLPADSILFAGNSMPVRDLDTFFQGSTLPIRVLGNRGANGIDGITSTALGISAATPPHEHVFLVIGDLSFFHDLNGLLAARLHQLNLTIILINNDGGGIFSFLPQADHPEHFEQLFGTPTGLDFRPVVQMYGGSFQSVSTWDNFSQALTDSTATGGLHVIELQTERASNVTMHRQLWQAVEQTLREKDPIHL